MDYIQTLKEAIKRLHGCESVHVETVPIVETFQGKTVWAGNVEVFGLVEHPKAKRCYAWSHTHGKDDKETRYVAVLEVSPIDTPRKAVQASIVRDARNKP